jgi:hypothetical protein
MNREQVKKDIITIMGKDAYSLSGIFAATSKQMRRARSEDFDGSVRACVEDLLGEGRLEKGRYFTMRAGGRLETSDWYKVSRD